MHTSSKGYWKDVGTIDSLWEANMDLLDKNNKLDLKTQAGRFIQKMQQHFHNMSELMQL